MFSVIRKRSCTLILKLGES